MTTNTNLVAILASINTISGNAPYSTAEATEAFRFQVRELLKELDALIEAGEAFAKPDVFGEWRKEVVDVKDLAAIFLGEKEWRFHHFECKCQGDIAQRSTDEGRGFCPLCGKQMERVVRLLEVKKPKEEENFVDNSCMICGSRCGSSTYCGCQD